MAKEPVVVQVELGEIKTFLGRIDERTARMLTTVDGINIQMGLMNGRVRDVEQKCAVFEALPGRVEKVEGRVKTVEDQVAEGRGMAKVMSALASLPGIGAIVMKLAGG